MTPNEAFEKSGLTPSQQSAFLIGYHAGRIVKPLEWEFRSEVQGFIHRHITKQGYIITKRGNGPHIYTVPSYELTGPNGLRKSDEFADNDALERLKAAAQLHHEELILSQLV